MPKGTRNCGCPSKRCYCHCARDPSENRCTITTSCRPLNDNGASWDPMTNECCPSTRVGSVGPGASWAGLGTCCGGDGGGGDCRGDGGGGGGVGGDGSGEGGRRDSSSAHGGNLSEDASQQQQMMIRTFVKRPRPNKDVLWAARFFFLTFFKPAYKEREGGSRVLTSAADVITSLALATSGSEPGGGGGGGRGGGGGGGGEAAEPMAVDAAPSAISPPFPLPPPFLCPLQDIDTSKYVVVHELANMYMWSFKNAMHNALGPGQLHSFINGRSFGDDELVFPYPPSEGFARTYPLLHKDYHLKNPVCIAGIQKVAAEPSLISEEGRKKWVELTGKPFLSSLPEEAARYTSWRTTPVSSSAGLPYGGGGGGGGGGAASIGCSLGGSGGGGNATATTSHGGGGTPRASLAGSASCSARSVPLSSSPSSNLNTPASSPSLTVGDRWATSWQSLVKGALAGHSGPVTASKTVYEDAHGYLIRVAMPYVDKKSVRVTWRNTAANCVVKVTATSIGGGNTLMRNGRIFKLSDPNPEICKTGLFSREICLPLLLQPNSNLVANFDPVSTGLEIMVPKLGASVNETEVPVTILNKFDRQAMAIPSGMNNYDNYSGSSGGEIGGGTGGRGRLGRSGGGGDGGGSQRQCRPQSLCCVESTIDSRRRQQHHQHHQRQPPRSVAGGGGGDGSDRAAQGRCRPVCCDESMMRDRQRQRQEQQQQQRSPEGGEGEGRGGGSGGKEGEERGSVPLTIDCTVGVGEVA